MEHLDPEKIGFRRMTLDDLPLMHRWLNTPQVLEWWWGGVGPTYAAVEEKYGSRIRGEEPTDAYFILYAGTPIGYIQTYAIHDYPDDAAVVNVDEDALRVDRLLG